MPRTIGLNALFLEPDRVGGTEIYTRQLVPELAAQAPDDRFILYLGREAGSRTWTVPDNVTISVVPARTASRVQRLSWELTALVVQARRDRLDLLHSLGTTAPFTFGLPSVVTIHDLIYEHFPEVFSPGRTAVLKRLVPRMARASDRVITDSTATLRDVVRLYRVPAERVDVVHLGPGRSPVALDAGEAADLRSATGIEGRYVLSVATTQPHKNLQRLLEAMVEVRRVLPDLRLVLVGTAGGADSRLRAAVETLGLADAVVFTGWVDDRTLDAVYAGASAYVFPSLCEGFGLPLLEAMERGVPIVSSDATSLPEVAGDAVRFVDARSAAAIATGMREVATDPELRRTLVSRGLTRVKEFSWERAARGTIAAYHRVLESRRR